MAVTWQDYITFINTVKVREPIYKMELLRDDETPLIEITKDIINNSGGLSIGGNQGVQRTCNFEIQNVDNKYTNYFANLNLNSKFKLYMGYKINGENFYISQGIFYFDDPKLLSNPSDRKIQISGTDKWSCLNGTNGGILEVTYIAEVGTKYSSIIRTLLALQIVNDRKDPIIDPLIENMTIPYTVTKEAGSTVADLILTIANSLSCHCYYNNEGQLVLEKVIPDNQKSVLYKFNRDNYNYLGSVKTLKNSEIYNAVLVIGQNIQTGTPIFYEAQNNNLLDKNSIPNIGRKKLKLITEDVEGIVTEELAKQRANWELQKLSGQSRLISIDAVGMYHLNSNHCIELQDDYIDSNFERFVIDSINLPIGTDNRMTITGYKNTFDD